MENILLKMILNIEMEKENFLIWMRIMKVNGKKIKWMEKVVIIIVLVQNILYY